MNSKRDDIQRERFELALKASNEGIWSWDLELDHIEYSDKILGFIGHTASSAPHLFHNISEIYHKQDAEKLQDTLDLVFSPNGPEVFGKNCRFKHPNGEWVWLRIRGACVRNADKKVIRLAGSVIDITKRKKAERELEEEKYLLDIFIESIPVNVYFKDKESCFTMANSATAQKMGLESGDQLIGNSDHTFFTAKHADKSLQDEQLIMKTGEMQKGTLEKETWTDQKDSWVITSKYPWLDGNDKIRGTFGVSNDVTDLVELQARLMQVARQLKRRNEEYEEELDLASEVQHSLLLKNIPPLVGEKHRIDVYPEYHPMETLAGDFYEVVTVSKDKIGVLMCDVMGHGVRAALIVAMLRGLVAKEIEHADHPDKFLLGLNQGFAKIMHRAGIAMFATAVYVVVDLTKEELTFAEAGHPLPIVLSDGQYRQLPMKQQEKSPALGLMPYASYQSQSMSLSEFSEFLLFTDGVYEIIDDSEKELGIDGMIQFLQSGLDTGVKHSLPHLLDSLREYSGEKGFSDDVCMVNLIHGMKNG